MGYKYVAELESVRKVPEHYARCSVCGKWFGTEEFRNEGETANSRSNCTRCYEADPDYIVDLASVVEKVHKGRKHFEVELQVKRLNSCLRNGITVRDMIKKLRGYSYDALVLAGDYYCVEIEKVKEVEGELEVYTLGGGYRDWEG